MSQADLARALAATLYSIERKEELILECLNWLLINLLPCLRKAHFTRFREPFQNLKKLFKDGVLLKQKYVCTVYDNAGKGRS